MSSLSDDDEDIMRAILEAEQVEAMEVEDGEPMEVDPTPGGSQNSFEGFEFSQPGAPGVGVEQEESDGDEINLEVSEHFFFFLLFFYAPNFSRWIYLETSLLREGTGKIKQRMMLHKVFNQRENGCSPFFFFFFFSFLFFFFLLVLQGDEQMYIWGTTVSLEHCKARFSKFVREFTVDGMELYMDLLAQMAMTGNYGFALDCQHLAEFDLELYKDLIRYPQEVTPIFDLTLHELYKDMMTDEEEELEEQIKVRPFRLLSQRPMRDLNPSDVGSLVSIQGMVTRGSQVRKYFFIFFLFDSEVFLFFSGDSGLETGVLSVFQMPVFTECGY
jgi:hypothetical protein